MRRKFGLWNVSFIRGDLRVIAAQSWTSMASIFLFTYAIAFFCCVSDNTLHILRIPFVTRAEATQACGFRCIIMVIRWNISGRLDAT
jgi:hypothetical protein